MLFKVYLISNLSVTKAVDSFGQFAILGLLIVTSSLKIIAKSNHELAAISEQYILPSISIFSVFSALYAILKAVRVVIRLYNSQPTTPLSTTRSHSNLTFSTCLLVTTVDLMIQ